MKTLAIALVIFLQACSLAVKPDHYNEAETKCEAYGGVKQFIAWNAWDGMGELTCNSGVVFSQWYFAEPNKEE